MSKFKVGDRVVAIFDNDQWFKKGASGVVAENGSSGENIKVLFDSGIYKNMDKGKTDWWGPIDAFAYENQKTKMIKKHTETDRRKAAKAVRELQDKLKKACEKAKEVGIKVKFQNACVDLIDIEMTYQPETPKMRKY